MKEIKYTLERREIFYFYLRANLTILVFWGVSILVSAVAMIVLAALDAFFVELVIVLAAAVVFFGATVARMFGMYRNSVASDKHLNSEITFLYSKDAISASAAGSKGATVKWASILQVIRFRTIIIFRLNESNTIILSLKAMLPDQTEELYTLIKTKTVRHNLH